MAAILAAYWACPRLAGGRPVKALPAPLACATVLGMTGRSNPALRLRVFKENANW